MNTGMSYTAPLRLPGTFSIMLRCLKLTATRFRSGLRRRRRAILSRIKELFVTTADHIEEDVVSGRCVVCLAGAPELRSLRSSCRLRKLSIHRVLSRDRRRHPPCLVLGDCPPTQIFIPN